MVRRMVEAINEGDEATTVDELFAPRAARRVKRLFGEFRSAFPDWREEIVELVAEGNTVAGRFRCSSIHLGAFLGEAPTGKRMMEVEEVFLLAGGGRQVRGLLGAGGQHGKDAPDRAHPIAEAIGVRRPHTPGPARLPKAKFAELHFFYELGSIEVRSAVADNVDRDASAIKSLVLEPWPKT